MRSYILRKDKPDIQKKTVDSDRTAIHIVFGTTKNNAEKEQDLTTQKYLNTTEV